MTPSPAPTRFHRIARLGRIALWGVAGGFSFIASPHAAGDVERGAKAAGACMACHAFAPGRHMTGPSLAGVWGRKAATAPGYGRYSDALKRSGTVWNEKSLDAWLKHPASLIPGNTMVFDGIADAAARADLLAYLQAVSAGRVAAPDPKLPDLKRLEPARQVTAIRHCRDAYRVVTGDRKTHTFWEFNLRFKTDGGADGPPVGKPVIVGTGMQGDRAAVVFARPDEISAFIRKECP